MKNNMESFAKSIYPLAKRIKDPTISKQEKKALNGAIGDILKKVGDLHPSGCSKAAFEKYKKIDPSGDIRDRTWHEQHKFDPGRKIFIREHQVTIKALREMCIANGTVSGIWKILVKNIRIIWVLKKEDAILTANGKRSNRPNPEEAYENAGIIVIPPESGWPVW